MASTEIQISDTQNYCTQDRISHASAADKGFDNRDERGDPGCTVASAFRPDSVLVSGCDKSVFCLFNAVLLEKGFHPQADTHIDFEVMGTFFVIKSKLLASY